MSYPFIIQGSNVTVVIEGKPHTVAKTHVSYSKVVDAIKASEWDTVKNIIDPVKVVLNYGAGNISIQGDKLFWKGEPFAGVLATRMISMLEEGFSIEPMVLFMHNLLKNPSKRSVDELYGFLEKNNLPITPDGHFLAYKKVRRDFLDIHSGTMNNAPGTIVEMERYKVDDNKDQTCSTGLHFCGMSYLNYFGGAGDRTVIVKIDPADVVSIPSDYNGAKGRACRYEVIGELGVEPGKAFDRSVQGNANGTETVRAPAPEPKVNHGPFSKGYSDGYSGNSWNNGGYVTLKERMAYDAGYDAGAEDREDGTPERYRYEPKAPAGWTRNADGKVTPPPGTTFTAQASHWPFPTKG
jgi:ribosome modulation factor